MKRLPDGRYELHPGVYATGRAGAWYAVDESGARLAGPYPSVLAIPDARIRRATLTQRTMTRRHRDGMLVEVRRLDGYPCSQLGHVVNLGPFSGFRWVTGGGAGGISPLYVAAVLATASAIDESEAS